MDTQPEVVEPSFVNELRRVLNHLYDWSVLHRSPLLQVFDATQRDDPPAALRRILLDAIEALKPAARVPGKARGWRTYRLLHSRYTEQFSQTETASELGLGVRHLRREESVALKTLAAYLWDLYDLGGKWQVLGGTMPSGAAVSAATDAETPSREQELEWLHESLPSQPAAPAELVEGVLSLVELPARRSGVEIITRLAESLPQAIVQLTPTRQALLNVLTTAIASVPGGRIAVSVAVDGSNLLISVQASASRTIPVSAEGERERLDMARRLVELSGGSLEIVRDSEGRQLKAVNIALPAQERAPVLVIDDNADTLQLLERYLSNTRYRFVGTSDPEQALALAAEAHPRIVVLDVMLPRTDGWELLGRLREHPQIRGVPIIVCTILPQEELALDLGAASFLRKPVSRKAFLAALDRQLAPGATGCC
ncbi:MAG: response regulator [Anaerolineae bacterium]|nr:response regulator [Anaerolineae bacterium]